MDEQAFVDEILADPESDDALRHLMPLKGLTSLDLGDTRLEGDPVAVLAHFRKLRKLHLDLCRDVGDDSLKELARKLPALREVSLRRTGVTRFRLAQLLPKTKWKNTKEVEAFEAFCREHGVLVDVDYE